jgi:8-oxo-dGTP pyrophosphatase MutT (NUDIX family)
VVQLTARIRSALQAPLPGLEAQLRLAPRPRVGWDPYQVPDGLRAAAALVLLYPVDEEPHVLLTVRGALRHHTGQVSFPGGAVDAGETLEEAAVREAVEEVGVVASDIQVLGRLTALHIPVSGFLLHPVVAAADVRPRFMAAPGEVARLLEVPLALLEDEETVRYEQRTFERQNRLVDVEIPFFDVHGEKVWGATAMVLAEFLALIAREHSLP